jgi:hypothetical protein
VFLLLVSPFSVRADIVSTWYSDSACTIELTTDTDTTTLGACVSKIIKYIAEDGSKVYTVTYYDDACTETEWAWVYVDEAGPQTCVAVPNTGNPTATAYLRVIVPAAGSRGPAPPAFLNTWPPADTYADMQCTGGTAGACVENCRQKGALRVGFCTPNDPYTYFCGTNQVLMELQFDPPTATCENLIAFGGWVASDSNRAVMCSGGAYYLCPTSGLSANATNLPAGASGTWTIGDIQYSDTTCLSSNLTRFDLHKNEVCDASGMRWNITVGGSTITAEQSFNGVDGPCTGTPANTNTYNIGECASSRTYTTATSAGATELPFACAVGWATGSACGEGGQSSSSSSSSSSSTGGNETDSSSSSSSSSSTGNGNNNGASASTPISLLSFFVSLLLALISRV